MFQFIVDESVVEARRGGIRGSARVKDARRACPINCALAHWARLTSRVEVASGNLKIIQIAAGLANGDDFGVRGGVVGRSDTVRSFGDHAAVFHDESRER